MLHISEHYKGKVLRQLWEYWKECENASGQYMQFRECKVITYFRNANNNFANNIEKITRKPYAGIMTDGAKKRLVHAVETLLAISPNQTVYNPVTDKPLTFRINFLTLTFPVDIYDYSIAQNSLQLFLQWMRDKKVKSYIWKAELTPTNNRIHYHITTNTFIHYRIIRNHWNKILKEQNLLNDYYKKNHHWDANSTDIHSCENINDLSAYLLKYISKNVSDAAEKNIDGKVWGCSKNLLAHKLFSIKMPDGLWSKLQSSVMNDFWSNDFIEIYKYKSNSFRNAQIPNEIVNEYQSYIKSITCS